MYLSVGYVGRFLYFCDLVLFPLKPVLLFISAAIVNTFVG